MGFSSYHKRVVNFSLVHETRQRQKSRELHYTSAIVVRAAEYYLLLTLLTYYKKASEGHNSSEARLSVVHCA
jgi:hypothetical protein